MENIVEKKVNDFCAYLQKEAAASKEESDRLIAAGHSDDANLEKIRGNIPGIFEALVKAAARGAETVEQLQERFPKKAEQIMTTWRLHCAIARRNGDTQACVIEEIKLQKADELLAAFAREMEA